VNARRAALATLAVLALILTSSAAARAAMPAQAQPGAASDTPLITTVAMVTIAPQTVDFVSGPQILFISADSRATSADAESAVGEMQQRLLNIKSALEKLGVPSAGIRFQGMNVMPQFGPPQPGVPSPVEKGQPLPQQVTTYTISGSMQADIPNAQLVVAAMNAATTNGATRVNVGMGKGGPATVTQPPTDLLQKATDEAIGNARATAEALAASAGKKLGAVHSVSVDQLMQGCCPPQANSWTLRVTISFEIAGP
jgi:uncharacterized protein YggE